MAMAALLRVLSRNRTGEAVAPYVPPAPNPNLLLWSEQFQQAAWAKTNVTVTPDAANDPNEALTADLLAPDIAGGSVLQQSPSTVTGGASYAASVYVKAAPGNPSELYLLRLRDDAGIVASSSGGAPVDWERRMVTGQLSAGATFASVEIITNIEDANGIYVWGAKLEEGSVATAYVQREGV